MDVILKFFGALASRWRQCVLRMRGAKVHGRCWLRAVEVPRNAWDIELGEGAALDRGVTLISTGDRAAIPRIRIGARCYINRFSMIDASEQISLGEDVLIGPHCYITDHDHTKDGGLLSKPVEIGNNAWLGAHVTVLKGVRIGTGTVIGAGSVVTKSVPDHAIAFGNPARVQQG